MSFITIRKLFLDTCYETKAQRRRCLKSIRDSIISMIESKELSLLPPDHPDSLLGGYSSRTTLGLCLVDGSTPYWRLLRTMGHGHGHDRKNYAYWWAAELRWEHPEYIIRRARGQRILFLGFMLIEVDRLIKCLR